MSIEIANESGFGTAGGVDEVALADVAGFVLAELGVNPLAELSVLLVDEPYMTSLHERWMGEPGPTDVLAFPMDELDTARGPDDDDGHATLLGDVVLCPAVAARQARQAGHSTGDELGLLTVHGVLHLLGYDHADAEEEREMFGLQGQLVADWSARARSTAAGPQGGRRA